MTQVMCVFVIISSGKRASPAIVTESVVPDHRLLSSACLCAFPVTLPLFSINSLFRPNEANISYLYLLVDISLYNTLVLASWFRFSSFLSLSPLISRLKTPRGSERALSPRLSTSPSHPE